MSGEEPERDPGPIWEHLPGFDPGSPADGRVVDAAGVSDRVRVGMANDDGLLPLPGAFEAYGRGFGMVFGQLRRFVAVVVLLAVLLIPVLPVVSVRTGAFLSTFVVFSLLPVTYVRREGATTRVSLVWLVGVLLVSSILNAPGIGFVLAWIIVPLVAVAAAAWSCGSWRRAVTSVVAMFARTWFGTIAALVVSTWTFGLLIAIPIYATGGFQQPSDTLFSVLGIGYLVMVTAFGIGYAQTALEHHPRIAVAEPVELPVDERIDEPT